MTERIEFVLPYPPTVNTYWRRHGNTYFISEAGERYRRDVALIVRQQRLKLNLSGRLAIKIIAEPPDKRRRDLDNILKAPLDALTHAGLLIDDEQFDEINIVRGLPVPGGRLGVKIYEITGDNDGARYSAGYGAVGSMGCKQSRRCVMGVNRCWF
ncbi:TPA: RusA family crossover junction endodeoxyribonuclease [Escherichia coli]|nr:RusA family crossover junction endodeoxyribonuclease [Escherichia coli]